MEIRDKIRGFYRGENRRTAWFITMVMIVFIGSWLFGSGNTLILWVKQGRELKRQERQIEEYRRQIEAMDGSIDQRETDLDTLEKFAREQYKFAVPGEDVYIIE
ncbi:MAG: septum formation initiator family protein [Bacteroidales bacterium]|nr:septum formation initiator family protein [Bacteroidales bacterium]